jgi:uncharacterized membrane protein YhaH (DUF805 family)
MRVPSRNYWIIFALLLVVSVVIVVLTTPPPIRTQALIVVFAMFGLGLLLTLTLPNIQSYPLVL